MKALEKDGAIDHDAIETKARVLALETIVAWQSNRLVDCLSHFPVDVKSRALLEIEHHLEKAIDEYKKIYIPSMSPMDSDYSYELFQEVFLEYVRNVQKSLGIPS